MSKWHEFRITTSDASLLELGVDSEEESQVSIDLNHVVSYYRNSNEKTQEEMTSVMLTGGWRHDVYVQYDEFKKLLTTCLV